MRFRRSGIYVVVPVINMSIYICIVRFPQLNMRFLRKLQQFVRDVEVGILLTL